MATPTKRRDGNRRKRHDDQTGLMPVLARAVREVEQAVRRDRVSVTTQHTFQATALLVRDERQRVKADADMTDAQRTEQLARLDGVATILAETAARRPELLALLVDGADVPKAVESIKRELQVEAGVLSPDAPMPTVAKAASPDDRTAPTPVTVVQAQLANPFMAPDFSVTPPPPRVSKLASWELIGPLLSSFERAAAGAPASMELPEPDSLHTLSGVDLMPHQAGVVEAAREGHRTFLLADEPGLGKTAQALLAADAANAFPLLVVVPNVVKSSWAREAERWLPRRTTTVVHGQGEDVYGFADVIVINYEILDRHAAWLGRHGFRGMVVDEAHFIKSTTSQRSRHVLEIADQVRSRTARPLMMALTGTPLINDVEDFRAIWRFLGWTDEKKPRAELMHALDETGLTPLDPGFFAAARQAVIDRGIVRRRKTDVARDIPARRIADVPVDLEGEDGRSVRDAERALVRRLLDRYDHMVKARDEARVPVSGDSVDADGIDLSLVRRAAAAEREDNEEKNGENVFAMVRRIGKAKAGLAADFTAQLARNVGKVVFFAKHLDVMDTAEEVFAARGLKTVTIRGDQTPAARKAAIESFVNDPDVAVIVCSVTAAGVGLNLQVASNVVLAELSWTDAEQRQAIDRVHRIGQTEPVTAWRVLGAQTIDSRIAELIDAKAGLADRALDGIDVEADETDVQLEALVGLLTDALRARLSR